MFHIASRYLGIAASPPKQIKSPGPGDGGTAILVKHEATKMLPGDNLSNLIDYWFSGGQKSEARGRKAVLVKGHRPARGKRLT